MDKKKRIEVNSSSLVGLKAELIRKQEEFKREKLDKSSNGTRERHVPKKTSIWNKKNAGLNSRMQKDAEELEKERNEIDKSRSMLEAKAKLYEQMTAGNSIPDEQTNSLFLVDFEKKQLDKLTNSKKGSKSGQAGNDEEEDVLAPDSEIAPPSNPEEEWVDYTDTLGRSRRCMRKDLPDLMKMDKKLHPEKFSKATEASHFKATPQRKAFLQEKGYIPGGQTSALDVSQFTTALLNFQRFYDLPETGLLDNATLTIMNKPRCGLPDVFVTTNDIDLSRYKRFTAFGGWNRNHITYDVDRYSKKLTRKEQDEALETAFNVYQSVTVLTFERRYDKKVDILISFFEPYYDHGDDRPFDGPSGVIAHAMYPFINSNLSGDIHFDESENWSTGVGTDASAFNLVFVATHEIGHSLGLGHSNVWGAVMYPLYFSNTVEFQLHPDDILGIEHLYGNGMTTAPNTRTKAQLGANNPNVPNLCKESMDAVIATNEGELIILKGSYVWRATDKGIKTGYPRLISQRWSGLQNNLHTGTQLKNTFWHKDAAGKLLFVKGKSLWRYNMKQELDASFPQDINRMLNVAGHKLNNLVGMFELRENGDIYLFGESEFYIYNWWQIVQGPFSTQEVFKGAPKNIAAIFQWTDNKIYFFTKTGLIFKYRSDNFQLDGPPTSWFNPGKDDPDWLSCSTNLVAGKMNSEARISGRGWILVICYLFVNLTLKQII